MQRKNSEDLNTCAIFNLVTKRTKMDTKLTEHKKYVSLCSTFKYIFCIGGYKASLDVYKLMNILTPKIKLGKG